MSWVAPSIPRFAERVALLRAFLKKAYASAVGTREKKAIARIPLSSLGWTELHRQSFEDLREQLCASTRLMHCNPDKVLCIHTDASNLHWAFCATQCISFELLKPPQDQVHEPLSFLSVTFSIARRTGEKPSLSYRHSRSSTTFLPATYLRGFSSITATFFLPSTPWPWNPPSGDTRC